MGHIAVITEKSSVATDIAKAMGWSKTGKGFEGTFEGKKVVVQWARGHLITLESPDDVNPEMGWSNPRALVPLPRSVKNVPIIMEPSGKGETPQARLEKVKSALKGASEVILATDPDREGEYIGWLILEHVNFTGPVRRCWLGEGTDEISIKKAMGSLLPASAKKSMARAAEARARCDWSYMYLVRLLTFYGRHGVLGDYLGRGQGRESVVSSGRVQSSALYMIYKLELAIENFVPKTFYNIFGDFKVEGQILDAEYFPTVTREVIESRPAGVTWEPQGLPGENKMDKPLFTDKGTVDAFHKRLMANAASASVEVYKEGKRERHPPITYDLVGAKSDLVKTCKIKGDVAQAVIEDLYEQGFISYPRTAHGELPNALYEPAERDSRLKNIRDIPGFDEAADRAIAIHTGKDKQYKAFKPRSFVSKKLEHHGLIPSNKHVSASVLTSMTPRKMLGNRIQHTSEHMQKGYRLIAGRYLQAMLPPATFATQSIVFKVPTEDILGSPSSLFQAKAERTIDSGYLGLFGDRDGKSSDLPKLVKGSLTPLDKVILKTGKTKAPSRYSEESFEKALQSAARQVNDPELRKYMADGVNKPEGIGTPATRKDIIPTLLARNYVSVDKKGQYHLDSKGREYIEFQMKNDHHWLYRIETTAQWEGNLAEMAALEDDAEAMKLRDQFVEDTLSQIEGYINWMNERFSKTELKQLPREAAKVTPKMKSTIKLIAERKGIPVPRGALTDPAIASKFFDEHGSKSQGEPSKDGTYPPSEAQLKFLATIEKAAGVKASDEVKADRQLLSKFIDQHKSSFEKQINSKPPTQKQIDFAKSLAEKLPEDKKPNPKIYESMAECSKFIDSQMGKRKK